MIASRSRAPRVLVLCAALIAALAAQTCVAAQTPPPVPASPKIEVSAPLPPAPAVKPSPVDFFRELLALSEAEREQRLADKPPAKRQVLLKKLKEYEALPREEREIRLRVLQLRLYLLPLMRTPRSQRAASLANIPEKDRALVTARLQQWDILPPSLQQEVLEHENAMEYFYRLEVTPPGQRAQVLRELSPQERDRLDQSLAHWQSLPDRQRQQMYGRFQQFLGLDPAERSRILSGYSQTERSEMERTLRIFENLPEGDREKCLEGFAKFAGLPPQDRALFLKNAQRWESMSMDERKVWRDLVAKLRKTPPVPPGLRPSTASVADTPAGLAPRE